MRIVSLVPSLTHTLFALGLDADSIVGRTAWCVEPEGKVDAIRVVGGTKTPSIHAIRELRPDLVILEKEENRREAFVEIEQAGIPTFVAHVTRVADVEPMLESLGAAVGKGEEARQASAELRDAHARAMTARAEFATRSPRPVAVPLIWAEPLMSIAPTRYGGDLLELAGFSIPDFEPGNGYPKVDPRKLGEAGVRFLLLSSEPHDFTLEEGRRIADAVVSEGFGRPRVVKIDGRALTWFGHWTARALALFRRAAEQADPGEAS